MYRNYVMAARGQNPDGSMIMTTMGDIQLSGLAVVDSKNQQSVSLQQKLKSLDAQIEQLRKQGATENEQQIKELMATRLTLVAQLQQSGASPSVDVKA